MPKVNRVGQPITPPQNPQPSNTPQRETQTITQADVGTIEVKSQDSSKVGGIDFAALAKSVQDSSLIPDWMQQEYQLETVDRPQGDWLGFCEGQGKHIVPLAQMGVGQGEPFAFIKQQYVKIKTPVRYFLLDSAVYRSHMLPSGNFDYVTRDIQTSPRELCQGKNFQSHHLYNHYVCLLLLIHENALWPLRADFRGPKEHAGAQAVRALEAAKTPEWLKTSSAHMLTATMPIPSGRVVNHMTLQKDVSKSTGKNLYRVHCSPNPATLEEMTLFLNSLSQPEYQERLEEAKRYFEGRLDFMDKLADKCEAEDAKAKPTT